MGDASAIVVAAGSSQRMAGADKLWLDLEGAPLLARTLEAIAATPGLAQLVVVGSAGLIERGRLLAGAAPWSRVTEWVLGGATRQDSVHNGILALAPCELVLIHDGARPLIGVAAIARGLAAARLHGAAIAAVPVTDTIKAVNADGRIVATPERAGLQAAQTPQIFAYDLLLAAYERVGADRARCTDDGAILERAGFPVYTYPGDHTNLKVSTPADVAMVRALWREGHP